MNETYYKIGLLIAVASLGAIFGVLSLFAHTIMPGLKSLSDAAFVKSFQVIDKAIVNPLFMLQFFGPIFLLGGLYWYAHAHKLAEAKYLLIATILYGTALVLTMAINVPLNDGLQKVDPNAGQATLTHGREAFNESRWVVANLVRTLLTFGATIFAVIAVYIRL